MQAAASFDLERSLRRIEDATIPLLAIPTLYFGPLGTRIPDVDWFVLAAIKKTASLTHAFCTLLRARNTLAAAALVRLQLDTALRIHGLTLVPDIEAAGTHLMNDGHYSKLKSRQGKELRDGYLHKELDNHYPGLSAVYHATSSYVHLTGAHIKTGLYDRPDTPTLFFHLNGTDEKRPDEWFADIVDGFDQATRLTVDLILDFTKRRYPDVTQSSERQ